MNRLKAHQKPLGFNDKGIMLIGLIAFITIVGIMGAGTLYFTAGSSQTGLFSSANSRAYYLAESGINYGKLTVAKGTTYKKDTQFKMANGDAFVLRTETDPKDAAKTIIYATGIVNPGSWFESKYDLTANYSKSGGGSGDLTDVVGLTVPNDKDKPVLNPLWSVKGAAKVKVKGDGYLQLTSTKGPKVTIGGGGKGKGKGKGKGGGGGTTIQTYYPILFSLGWWKSSPAEPDLYQQWLDNEKFLGYEAQVKIKLDGPGEYFMHGISFRLSPQNPDWTKYWNMTSYGISFFRAKNTTWPFTIGLSGFTSIMNNSVYIVLWKKVYSNNILYLVDYRKLTTSDGVLDGSGLKDWATLLVKLEEDTSGWRSYRANKISAFVQGPSTIPLGSIEWDKTKFNSVQWKYGHPQPILDYSLTSKYFYYYKPDEIGFHAFYETTSGNKQYFGDFSISFGATASGGSGSSYQW